MPIRNWSTTAASNNDAAPFGAPEGTFRFSEINDTFRQIMADVRTWYENPAWIDQGDSVSFISAASFKVNNEDVTGVYVAGRRIRASVGVGDVYGDIVSSTFVAADTNVVVTLDSGALDSSLSSVAVSFLSPGNTPIPSDPTIFAGDRVSVSALAAQTGTISALTVNNASISALVADRVSTSALGAATASISSAVVGSLSVSSLVAGTLSTSALVAAGRTVVGLFQSSYDSGDLTITLAGSYSLTHSLGGVPTLVQAYLHCLTATAGYSAGDHVITSTTGDLNGADNNRGVSIVIGATAIRVQFGDTGSLFCVLDASGLDFSLDHAKWNFVVRAFR